MLYALMHAVVRATGMRTYRYELVRTWSEYHPIIISISNMPFFGLKVPPQIQKAVQKSDYCIVR